MKKWWLTTAAVLAAVAIVSKAETATPFKALARMPIKEITVFKDGHALVLHSGKMPVDSDGNVTMDYLPAPVMGTFWPFSTEKKTKLNSVVAGQRKVLLDRTAVNLRQLIEANIGAKAVITESAATPYTATIVSLPAQSGDELEATSPPHGGEKLSLKGGVVLLRTETGVRVVNLDRIQDITFLGDYRQTLGHEEFRNLMTLKLDWEDNKPGKNADVGLFYLQRGIRWIPNYKVTIDGKGKAVVKLQATIINELADMQDVTANLVIGVPTFEFKETVDPISLQQQLAQLSQHFRPDSQTAYGFANSIMSQQTARMTEYQRPVEAAATRTMDLGPDISRSGKAEDLFVFTVKHITLKKGQRMVLPVGEFTIEYKDVYALDIPVTPPAEVRRHFDSHRQAELARMFNAPKVQHKIRLFNTSEYPLTTAPALILRGEQVLAQGLMTFTAPGAATDLNITTAVDIGVKKTETELLRTPNAANWHGDQYGKIDLEGKIILTSYRKDPIKIEVVRNVLGNVVSTDNSGKSEMVNVFEDNSFGSNGSEQYPYWWGWYSWPWWWHHFNGVGRITWTATLEPGKPLALGYNWNYYWR